METITYQDATPEIKLFIRMNQFMDAMIACPDPSRKINEGNRIFSAVWESFKNRLDSPLLAEAMDKADAEYQAIIE